MKYLLQKYVLWIGTLGVSLMIALFCFFVWKQLISHESTHYGSMFIKRFVDITKKIDAESEKTFTKELYNKFHQTVFTNQTVKDTPELLNLESRLKEFLGTNDVFITLYTDCANALCYGDTDIVDYTRSAYEPKSRPWYLASRAHTDWVWLQFMFRGRTKLSGYPATWGVTLAKRFFADKDKEEVLLESTKDKRAFSNNDTNEKGLWILISIADMDENNALKGGNISQGPILKAVAQDSFDQFNDFEVSFKTLRMPKPQLYGQKTSEIQCSTITDLHFITYRALVQCLLNGEEIQFRFSKKYDSLWVLVLLFLLGSVGCYTAYWFFSHVYLLSRENIKNQINLEKGRVINEVGAKLLHDLKKGTFSKINRLALKYEQDYEQEVASPKFHERLKKDLDYHFKALAHLNNFITLLTNNFKRQREPSWRQLTAQSLTDYLKWMVGKCGVENKKLPQGKSFLKATLTKKSDGWQVISQEINDFPALFVPDLSFYRVLKNLWENYNAYGEGDFVLEFKQENDLICLRVSNLVSQQIKTSKSSTHLGLLIIQQLIEDNFGSETRVTSQLKNKEFYVTINFKQFKQPPDHAFETTDDLYME